MQDHFRKAYKQASIETKVSFLTHLLHADQKLQHQFLDYSEIEPKAHALPSLEDFAHSIIHLQEEIVSSLQEIDLQYPNWDDYTPSHSGYMKEWEQYEDASQQELQYVIDQYQTVAINHLIGQQLDAMFATIIGLFIACRDTHLEDPIPTFDTVNEFLTDMLEYTFHELREKIDYAILPEVLIQQTTLFILEYCQEYRGNDSGFIEAVQPLIHALVKKLENTETLLTQLNNVNKVGQQFPLVYACILRSSRHQKKWLAFAKKTYLLDPEITKELLQFYYGEKMQKPFKLLARKVFITDQRQWAPFLKPLVNLQVDKALYLDVHLHLIVSNRDFEIYQEIRPNLSPKQVNHLIDEIWDKEFVVQILAYEKRYEDIKQLVKKNYDHYSFVEIITPILNIYPKYCFQTLKRLVFKQLDNERGRSAYRRIVQKLILATQILGYETSAEKLIDDVFYYNNRLSALRDEMRSGGLIES